MKTIKIITLLLIITVLITQTQMISNLLKPKTAYAVGDLSIDFGEGVIPGDPLFTIANMAPGDTSSEELEIKNNAPSARPVAIKGVVTNDTDDLSTQIDITITDGSTTIYGPKTAKEFFTDSLNPEGIPLATINAGQTKTYTITAKFKESAGNEFQNATLTFSLVIGISVDIPLACENINLNGRFPIFGTTGNDTLRGSSKDDVIFALEGNDRIDGGAGKDCLVGGPGADILSAGAGDDVIEGQDGNDTITAGSGNDTISGGNGNDRIQAEAGNDRVNGDSGNDNITGGAGNDVLYGGLDTDTINGHSGKDSCSGETLTSCEVIL